MSAICIFPVLPKRERLINLHALLGVFAGAVVISFCAVVMGAACYLVYAKKERGHLLPMKLIERVLKKQQ